MEIFIKKLSVIILASVFIFIGCNSSTNKTGSDDKSVAEKIMNKQDIKPDIKEALYQFPTPLEATVMLNDAKAAFIFDITNPVENLDKYMTEQDKALFLGVYSADLSYAAAYNRSDEIEKLLECTGTLSDELGISGIYNDNLVDVIKDNYSNQDSLVNILSTVFDDTKRFLSDNNRDEVSVLIISAGFIETMYIATSLNLLSENNKSISEVIFGQTANVGKLINILGVFNNNELLNSISKDLDGLKAFFENNSADENGFLAKEKSEELKTLVEQIRNNLAK